MCSNRLSLVSCSIITFIIFFVAAFRMHAISYTWTASKIYQYFKFDINTAHKGPNTFSNLFLTRSRNTQMGFKYTHIHIYSQWLPTVFLHPFSETTTAPILAKNSKHTKSVAKTEWVVQNIDREKKNTQQRQLATTSIKSTTSIQS